MKELQYNHKIPLQLRFNDIDQFGHVNNTIYFSFYDLGKTEYFKTLFPDLNWEETAIVLVHVEVDFLSQIYADDKVDVETAVTEIGNKSFKLSQRVIQRETKEVKCIAESVMVAFDMKERVAVPIPQLWIDTICNFEGRELRLNH